MKHKKPHRVSVCLCFAVFPTPDVVAINTQFYATMKDGSNSNNGGGTADIDHVKMGDVSLPYLSTKIRDRK